MKQRFFYGGADHCFRCKMCQTEIDCNCPKGELHDIDQCGICKLQSAAWFNVWLVQDLRLHYVAKVFLRNAPIFYIDGGSGGEGRDKRDWLVHEFCIALERQGVL